MRANQRLLLVGLTVLSMYVLWHVAGSKPNKDRGRTSPGVNHGAAEDSDSAILEGRAVLPTGLTPPPTPAAGSTTRPVVFGSVVDPVGAPAPGVEVVVSHHGVELARTLAGQAGRFAIDIEHPGVEPLSLLVNASDSEGRIAHRTIVLGRAERQAQYELRPPGDCGVLTLGRAYTLRVRAILSPHRAGVVAVVSIFPEPRVSRGRPCRVLEVLTGSEARVSGLPRGEYLVIAEVPGAERGSAGVRLGGDPEHLVEVLLSRGRDVVVRVVSEDGKPIGGASVETLRMVTWQDGAVLSRRRPLESTGKTDSRGQLVLHAVGPRERLEMAVSAPGYDAPAATRSGHGRARLGSKAEQVTVVLRRSEPRMWPVDRAVGVPPREGSPVRILAPGESGMHPHLAGRVRDGLLVMDVHRRVPLDFNDLLAVSTDGAVARLFLTPPKRVGERTSFHRPKQLSIHVRHANGRPASDFPICVVVGKHCIGGVQWTGPNGGIEVPGLPAAPGTIYHYAGTAMPWGGMRLAEFDTRSGEGVVEIQVPRPHLVRVAAASSSRACRLETARISLDGHRLVDVEAGLQADELLLQWQPPTNRAKATLVIQCGAHRPESFTLSAQDTSPHNIELDPRPSCRVVATVHLPADGRAKLVLQRWDEHELRWNGDALGGGRRVATGPSGTIEINGLAEGRYRLCDKRSRIASSPTWVSPTLRTPSLVLDLRDGGYVRGTVVGPGGTPLPHASVHASWSLTDESSVTIAERTVAVSRSGEFVVLFAEGQIVRLHAMHARFAAAPDSISRVVTEPRDDIVLSMVEGPRAVLHLDSKGAAALTTGQSTAPRVFVTSSDGTRHRVKSEIRGTELVFAGYAPGPSSVWVDLGRFRPIRLEGVSLGSSLTDLGQVELSYGSSILLSVLVKPGARQPMIQLSAEAIGGQRYARRIRGSGRQLRLNGLGDGKFHVSAVPEGRATARLTTTVELSAAEERVLTLDLR